MKDARQSPLIEVRLEAVRFLAEGTHLLEFRRPSGGVLPSADAGAHISLHLPNGNIRQYSLLAAQSAPLGYSVAVKRIANGRGGSRYIHDVLRVGQVIKIEPPRNKFLLQDEAEYSVLIAGGIGITPIWCMLNRLKEFKRPWQLHYACRSREEAAFLNELEKERDAHFHFDIENDGRVLDIRAVVERSPASAHLYCCGPEPMIAAFLDAVGERAISNIHVEYFVAKSQPATSDEFIVELARSGRQFTVCRGKTILETLREAGVDVAYSCEEGICGTCETAVLDGVPDHRDSILSAAERAAGNTMMICCSRSKTARILLDL